jgi:hypothetical protein
MAHSRSYSDEQLVSAIATARSWRGVLRCLGLAATSASAMRSVRRHAERLGLDHSHFTGQRRWTDQQLAEAVATSSTWTQVAETLGLTGGSSTTTIRGHAVRLGLDTAHLTRSPRPSPHPAQLQPSIANLSRAGSLLAAAWFELSGHHVSWPLEPCRYDLLVWKDGAAQRIQVKTTTMRSGNTWMARLASMREEVRTYGPEEIDAFFVIDGDLNHYLIPFAVVGGLSSIHVSAYRDYLLPRLA